LSRFGHFPIAPIYFTKISLLLAVLAIRAHNAN
jgi:hypothetical protein